MDLKLELMKRGISQIRMAHDLGIHQSRLSNIVNGWVKPTRDQRRRIANYLGLSVETLFGYEEGQKHQRRSRRSS